MICDVRYPFEYDGGHLVNAQNIYTLDQLDEMFIHQPSLRGHQTLVIFHCEFSAQRGMIDYSFIHLFLGPLMAQCLRKKDREISHYPFLHYPQIYILEGGYHKFYHQYKNFEVINNGIFFTVM
jgi:M-phase inducer phosphatase